MVYESEQLYIDDAADLAGKITAIDNIVAALLIVAVKAANTENISEHSLDDGQTKIRTVYRGANAVWASINAWNRLKEYYVNKLNGRHFRLMDHKNFYRG